MAQLTVRAVPDEVAAALKARAAQAGRSAEDRRILEEALFPQEGADLFEAARARRVKPPPGTPSTTALLRRDRDRDETRGA